MLGFIKKWWRPSTFTVTYCIHFGMLQDHYDKYKYDNLPDAESRLNYLGGLSKEDLLAEGVKFVPNYFRIEQVMSPHPIRRFLNRCGSKRAYKIFGWRI